VSVNVSLMSFDPFTRYRAHIPDVLTPGARCIPSPASRREEIEAFHHSARQMAEEFRSFFKESDGVEPRPEALLTPEQECLVSTWLDTAEGKRACNGVADRVISFLSASIGHGHPGHDKRHVLFKDPIAGLRLALEEDLSPCRQLFIIPSLLHDVGRLYEPAVFARPQSGVAAVDHAALSFLVAHYVLADDFRTESADVELALALAKLRNELLNAILDHQTGNSRGSFIAQAVQRADREQLVGYEILHRSLSFDVGFHGLQIRGMKIPERFHSLALPGHQDGVHLFHHVEFYMRNLFANVGSQAERHSDKGKIESGRFLWLAASPEMRAQIFAPEIARDRGNVIPQGTYKSPLEPHVWRAIHEYSTDQRLDELATFRGLRSLRDLAREFVHPPYATRSDVPGSENWPRIDAALNLLSPLEKRRMGDALSYGLLLAQEVTREDRGIIDAAAARFGAGDGSLLGRVAAFTRNLT
jgi:hypothetical protein